MIFGLPLHAQEDTIVTVVGQRYGVTVQGFKDNPLDRYVKVSPYMDEKGLYMTRCPGGLVDRIIFADGFVLKMENGHVMRDNVTEAPRYTGGTRSVPDRLRCRPDGLRDASDEDENLLAERLCLFGGRL